jgi:hypothetical protein
MASKKKLASVELDCCRTVQQQNGSVVVGASTNAEIARRAYEIYLERGSGPGLEVDDWLRAEREVKEVKGSHQDHQ